MLLDIVLYTGQALPQSIIWPQSVNCVEIEELCIPIPCNHPSWKPLLSFPLSGRANLREKAFVLFLLLGLYKEV